MSGVNALAAATASQIAPTLAAVEIARERDCSFIEILRSFLGGGALTCRRPVPAP